MPIVLVGTSILTPAQDRRVSNTELRGERKRDSIKVHMHACASSATYTCTYAHTDRDTQNDSLQ